jgi:lysophospholipase L1-like esterase
VPYSKWIRIFFGFLVWLICSLVLLELILRLLGSLYLGTPDFSKAGAGHHFNIVCLGDSVTYGWGVDRALTYPKQLEKMLNQKGSGDYFKVFNLAVPGTNSSQHLQYLRDIFEKNKSIGLVIILTGANDPWNFAQSHIDKFVGKQGLAGTMGLKLQILLADLRIYKMFKILALNTNRLPQESEVDRFEQIRLHEKVDVRVLDALLEYNLTQMALVAQAHHVKIIFQNYPAWDPDQGIVSFEVAQRTHMSFVNHASVFRDNRSPADFRDLFLYDHFHPNAQGCALMAKALYDVIIGIAS